MNPNEEEKIIPCDNSVNSNKSKHPHDYSSNISSSGQEEKHPTTNNKRIITNIINNPNSPLLDDQTSDAENFYQIGLDYLYGRKGLKIDNKKAIQAFFRAYCDGHVLATAYIGFCYYVGKGLGADEFNQIGGFIFISKVRSTLHSLADQEDNTEAQYLLGSLYLMSGIDLSEDLDQAKKFLEKAIAKGYAPAMYARALMYKDGITSYKRAKALFERAVNKDNADAMRELALMYKNGLIGTELSKEDRTIQARQLLERAIKKGDVYAMCVLVRMHEDGLIDKTSTDQERFNRYNQIIGQSNTSTMYSTLGNMYWYGYSDTVSSIHKYEYYLYDQVTAPGQHLSKVNRCIKAKQLYRQASTNSDKNGKDIQTIFSTMIARRIDRLEQNDPTLTTLHLRYYKLTNSNVSFLEKALLSNTRICHINLSDSHLNLTFLKEYLEKNPSLISINLSHNPIGHALEENQWSWPYSNYSPLQPLLDYLKHNTTLTSLDLSHTYLDDTDIKALQAVIVSRRTPLYHCNIEDNSNISVEVKQSFEKMLKQAVLRKDRAALLAESQPNDAKSSLIKAIKTECERAMHQADDEAIDIPKPINTYSFEKEIFEEIPTPADGHCGFYGLLDDPFAVFRSNQDALTEDVDNPFINVNNLLTLASEKRAQVKAVLLAPFQDNPKFKSEANDNDDAPSGDPVKQTLIAEHLQEEVKDFFSKHPDVLPHAFQKTYTQIKTAQETFDSKKSVLSDELQPYDPTLERSTYRGFAHLPPMEAPYQDLRSYLIMLQAALQRDKLPDSDGELIKIIEKDLADWEAILEEKETLAEKTSQFYTNPALTKAYLEEAFDGKKYVWLGRYSAHLYGTMSGKGVEIYTINAQTGALEIDTAGQLTPQAKQTLSPPVSNANGKIMYRLHYTRTQFSQYPNHFTRLVSKGTAKKHLNAIPHTAQQYRQAYRRYYALLMSVAAAFTPNPDEKARIHEKINQELALTPRELLTIKADVLTATLDKLPDSISDDKQLPIREPKTQWEQLRDAYLNFMPLPTKDKNDGTSSLLIRLGQAMLTVDDQLRNFEAREARQQHTIRDIKITSPLNMPLTPKEWALKAQFFQEFNHLYAAANTLLSHLVERDHDLSKTEEAWRCIKTGILSAGVFIGGVSEIIHTLGSAGHLLHKAITHGKIGKFTSEAFEAFEKIPGVEKGVHTLLHFSEKAIAKVSNKEFLTTHKKLEHLSNTFMHQSTHDQYLEDLINHFIYAYKAQIVTLADQEEAAKWGKALAEHTLQAVFAGIMLGYEFSTIDNFTHYMTQWIQYIPMQQSPMLNTLTYGKVSADTLIKAPLPICQTEDGQRIAFPLNPFTIQMQEGYTKYRCKKDTFDYPGSNPAYGYRIANAREVNALQHESKEACAFEWPNVAEWTLEMGEHHLDQEIIKTVKPIDCPWKNPRALAQQVTVLEKRVEGVEEQNEQLEKDNKSLKKELSNQKETINRTKTESNTNKKKYKKLKQKCVNLTDSLTKTLAQHNIEFHHDWNFSDTEEDIQEEETSAHEGHININKEINTSLLDKHGLYAANAQKKDDGIDEEINSQGISYSHE